MHPHGWPGKAASPDTGGAGSANDPASAAGYSATLTSMLRPVFHLQANVAQPQDRRAFFVNPAKQLDDEAMKKSAAAAQQLGSIIGDPASIGAKLMSKMGFGVAGQGLGRAGQVRYAP